MSARPFQGIVESIQNGDDLGATELRVALRANELRRELLIVHNGAPISLEHVGAMVLPWVSTKADDPLARPQSGCRREHNQRAVTRSHGSPRSRLP